RPLAAVPHADLRIGREELGDVGRDRVQVVRHVAAADHRVECRGLACDAHARPDALDGQAVIETLVRHAVSWTAALRASQQMRLIAITRAITQCYRSRVFALRLRYRLAAG